MSDDIVFPPSYEEWRHCIELLGGISLTPTYVKMCLTELQDSADAKTKE